MTGAWPIIRGMKRSSLLMFPLLCLAQSSMVFAACSIKIIAEIPVRISNNRATIEAKADGQAVRMLLDTGSSTSFISEAEAKRLNLHVVGADGLIVNGVGGEARVFSAYVKRLEIGNVPQSDLRMVVIGSQKQKQNHVPDYVLGEDFFANFISEFDFAHSVVRLLRQQNCKPEQLVYWSKEFSIAALERTNSAAPSIAITVQLNGRPIDAVLDSGAHTSIMTRSAAEATGMHFDETTSAAVVGLSGRPLASWVRTFPSLSLGDNETVQNVKLRVADLFGGSPSVGVRSHILGVGHEMPSLLLGFDFFLAHRIIVLFNEGKLMFTYNGGPIFQVIETDQIPDAQPAAETPQTTATAQ
jgi:predicted aspartyl protease